MEKIFTDVSARIDLSNSVATVEICRPPYNFFDAQLIGSIADALEWLTDQDQCRAVVLAAQGKAFCAGAQFQADSDGAAALDAGGNDTVTAHLYSEAVRLFRTPKPVVGAIHGAAIGGGLGLAMACDFRVVCPETRFAANFVKLGISPGFGLTLTLPRIIGQQRAALLMLTGRRIKGEDALEWGLGDIFCPLEQVRERAVELAAELAEAAPLALVSTRSTLRGDLADAVAERTNWELQEQTWQRKTEDHAEGVRAVSGRRQGKFVGR